MNPSRRATTALHMYAPMFVVEVCRLVVPSLSRLSAGSPEDASVIASNDAQVRSAYWRSGSRWPRAEAPEAGTSTSSATSAAIWTMRMSDSLQDLSVNATYPHACRPEPRGFDPARLGGETLARLDDRASEGGLTWVEGDASRR